MSGYQNQRPPRTHDGPRINPGALASIQSRKANLQYALSAYNKLRAFCSGQPRPQTFSIMSFEEWLLSQGLENKIVFGVRAVSFINVIFQNITGCFLQTEFDEAENTKQEICATYPMIVRDLEYSHPVFEEVLKHVKQTTGINLGVCFYEVLKDLPKFCHIIGGDRKFIIPVLSRGPRYESIISSDYHQRISNQPLPNQPPPNQPLPYQPPPNQLLPNQPLPQQQSVNRDPGPKRKYVKKNEAEESKRFDTPQISQSLPSAQEEEVKANNQASSRSGDSKFREQESYDSYDAVFKTFKRHVYELANPYAVDDIVKILQQLRHIQFDFSFKEEFNCFPISNETLEIINSYSQEITRLLNQRFSQTVIDPAKKILEDLHGITYQLHQEYQNWIAFRYLMNISAIRLLPNSDIKRILKDIKEGSADVLRESIDNIFKKHRIDPESVGSDLASTDYEDLDTLLGQVIEEKPQKREDILQYWDYNPDFFLNKTIYIQTESKDLIKSGLIMKCVQNESGFLFQLHDQSVIKIHRESGSYSIKILNKVRYNLWKAVQDGILENSEFEVGYPETSVNLSQNMILPGVYKHYKLKVHKYSGRPDYKEELILIKRRSDITYKIIACYENLADKYPIFKINRRDNPDSEYNPLIQISSTEFNRTYFAFKREVENLNCNPTNCVLIKDENDESLDRFYKLREIDQEIESIVIKLSSDQERSLIENLLDNLINNQTEKVDMHVLQRYKHRLASHINDISIKYKYEIKIERSPEEILKQVVVDSNYGNLINKTQSLEVSKAMELLRCAYSETMKIENKDIVMFIGNTGSGKSTAINYLLGADVDYFINKAGDKAVRVKQTTHQTTLPKIGQALTESETIYVQGYAPPSNLSLPESIMLADCPGFNDTRGGHYELCTSLSIDQAIEKARSIKSLVLTIPIQAFTIDRGNLIVELIENVKESFRNSFDPDNSSTSECIFILVTKSGQVNPGVVDKIKNGARFQELLNESNKIIEEIRSRGNPDSFELDHNEKRHRIWQSIWNLHNKGHISIIDIKNKLQRRALLKQYCALDSCINKQNYLGLMNSRELKTRFEKYIEMFTHTWTHLILNEYLFNLPNSIQEATNRVSSNQDKIKDLKLAKAESERKLIGLEGRAKELESALSSLGHRDGKFDSVPEIKFSSSEESLKIKSEIKGLKRNIEQSTSRIQDMSSEIQASVSQIVDLNINIQKIESEIKELSKGHTTVNLWSEDYRGQESDYFTLVYYKTGAAERIFDEVREIRFDETYGERTVCIGTYTGRLLELPVFEKEYKLVPNDPDLRQIFLKKRLVVSGDYKYEAIVEGEGIGKDIRCNAKANGKKIIYWLYLEFDGFRMPWINIRHDIPNEDYNEASILNKSSELNTQVFKNNQLENDKALKLRLKLLEDQKLSSLNENLVKKKALLKQVNKESYQDQIKTRLNEIKSEVVELRKSIDIQEELQILEADSLELDNTIKSSIKKKKYLGVIIVSQLDTAKLLREFVDMFIRGSKKEITSSEVRPEILRNCDEFMEVFDRNIQELTRENILHSLV